MNNLEKAKRALSGKKKYRVTFSVEETFDVEVEAENEEQAEDEAWDIYNNGDANSNGQGDTEVVHTEEVN